MEEEKVKVEEENAERERGKDTPAKEDCQKRYSIIGTQRKEPLIPSKRRGTSARTCPSS